ncbi:protein mab-21-like [Amphiura filiformis]|uniref:protein mab-21-like n=1 Tax=Amphiura filiformis TaxID=82378 RepID=UPI003B2233AD
MAATAEEDRKKQSPSLTQNLNDFLEYTAIPRRREISRTHERIIRRAVNPIVHEIGGFDDRFYVDPIDASGCYVGITHTDEFTFDILVPLPNILTPKILTKKSEFGLTSSYIDSCTCDNPYIDPLPGFGFVVADPNLTFTHDLCSKRDDCVLSTVQESFVTHAYLSPVRVLEVFKELVQQAVDKLEEECWWEREPTVYQVEVEKQGPSVTLTFLLGGETFTISLLPTIKFPGWPESINDWGLTRGSNVWLTQERSSIIRQEFHVFAAQPPEDEDASRLWCVCFYPLEKALAATADEGTFESCRQKTLAAIEAIYEENSEDFHPVSARLIRTIFLHQCVHYPNDEDWLEKRLGRAFVDLFLAIIKSLKQAKCQHVFLTDQNMLGNRAKWDLKPVVHHLKAILNDIIQNPDKTAFLPVPGRIRKMRRTERKGQMR